MLASTSFAGSAATQQVLSLANPPLESIGPPVVAAELARIANDCLAEICRKHPRLFPTFKAVKALHEAQPDFDVDKRGARGRAVSLAIRRSGSNFPARRLIRA
jgi:hypothetical protein